MARKVAPRQADVGGIAADQLRSIVERIERLEEEKKALSEDIKDVYAEAKGNGFDLKVLRKIISLRKRDRSEVDEEETILELYCRALGMLPGEFEDDRDEQDAARPASGASSSRAGARVNPLRNKAPEETRSYGEEACRSRVKAPAAITNPAPGAGDEGKEYAVQDAAEGMPEPNRGRAGLRNPAGEPADEHPYGAQEETATDANAPKSSQAVEGRTNPSEEIADASGACPQDDLGFRSEALGSDSSERDAGPPRNDNGATGADETTMCAGAQTVQAARHCSAPDLEAERHPATYSPEGATEAEAVQGRSCGKKSNRERDAVGTAAETSAGGEQLQHEERIPGSGGCIPSEEGDTSLPGSSADLLHTPSGAVAPSHGGNGQEPGSEQSPKGEHESCGGYEAVPEPVGMATNGKGIGGAGWSERSAVLSPATAGHEVGPARALEAEVGPGCLNRAAGPISTAEPAKPGAQADNPNIAPTTEADRFHAASGSGDPGTGTQGGAAGGEYEEQVTAPSAECVPVPNPSESAGSRPAAVTLSQAPEILTGDPTPLEIKIAGQLGTRAFNPSYRWDSVPVPTFRHPRLDFAWRQARSKALADYREAGNRYQPTKDHPAYRGCDAEIEEPKPLPPCRAGEGHTISVAPIDPSKATVQTWIDGNGRTHAGPRVSDDELSEAFEAGKSAFDPDINIVTQPEPTYHASALLSYWRAGRREASDEHEKAIAARRAGARAKRGASA